MPVTDMTKSNAMNDWWAEHRRRTPNWEPSPADAFGAGFDAARKIYRAHAEDAIKALLAERAQHEDAKAFATAIRAPSP